jgi:hypothetical protein
MSKTRFSLHVLSAGPGDLDVEEQLHARMASTKRESTAFDFAHFTAPG